MPEVSRNQLRSVLSDELTGLRRSGLVRAGKQFWADSLCGAIANGKPDVLLRKMSESFEAEDPKRLVVLHIFDVTLRQRQLTERREKWAKKQGISTRTAARWEDATVKELVEFLADEAYERLQSDNEFRSRVEKIFFGLEPSTTAGSASSPDIPSNIRHQAVMLKAMSIQLDQLREQIETMQTINTRLAELAGVDID